MLDDSDAMILSVVVAVIFWLCVRAAAAGVWESITAGGSALECVRVMHLHGVAAGHQRGAVAGGCVASLATPRDHLSYENNEYW
eukprot:COSAG02_NODE_27213_length_614_cov_6.984466_1_plen_84_part_00